VSRQGGQALKDAEEASGEVALEAAVDVAVGFAFGGAAGDVGLGFGVVAASAGERDAVDGGVELAVAAAVQPVSGGLAGGGFQRADAGQGGECGLVGE
jgi:hypothetical protein